MGYYTRIIEQLHTEYCNRTSISVFGRQATMLRLLADSYEVGLRFERLLEKIQKGPTLLEDADMDFLEWAADTKWKKPINDEVESTSSTALTFGFSEESPFSQTYANHMKDALGNHLNNIDIDRFTIIMSSVIATPDVIPDIEFEAAIDANIEKLKTTLRDINNFKKNKRWEKGDYERMYQQLHKEYLDCEQNTEDVKRSHREWLKDIVTEPDMDDYKQRRRELLLELFSVGFLKALKSRTHVPAQDELQFSLIQDEAMLTDLTETLKCYAAFKKLCPKDENHVFSFEEHGTLGRYIFDNNISKEVCWSFFRFVSLMEIVQQEMVWLEHPETKPKGEDETINTFVERVKQIMLKAEEKNGMTIKYKDNKHNDQEYRFNVEGKLFCKVIDELRKKHPKLILDYLDGKTGDNAIGVTAVCPFIGKVLGMCLFNKESVRNIDLKDAFEFVYSQKNKRGQRPSFIQKMSATKDIKDKPVFETIKTLFEEHKRS